jgi:hypothetical protein
MWVGILCFMSRCCVSMFRPGMVPNQRQLVMGVGSCFLSLHQTELFPLFPACCFCSSVQFLY